MGTKFGIDISRWQKGLSLSQAKSEGVEFVIIKGGGADSGLYKDSQFDNFYNQAINLNLSIGCYYFGQAFSVDEAKKEAQHFVSILSGKDINRVFYDVEAKMLNQGRQHLTDIVKVFCDTMNKAGYKCGIYMSASPFRTQVYDTQLSQYSHWVASYGKGKPSCQNNVDIWQFGGEINYIRSNKIAGKIVDQNYLYVDNYFSNDLVVVSADTGNKTIQELVDEVFNGLWGNGTERKRNLEAAGYDYAQVQAAVDAEYKKRNEKTEKTIDQLANEVLAGVWGNNPLRRIKLLLAGYDATAVQKRVDEICKQRKQEHKTYVVVKGDTLSSIAKKYNTSVAVLQKINAISDPNKIYVGQVITIA